MLKTRQDTWGAGVSIELLCHRKCTIATTIKRYLYLHVLSVPLLALSVPWATPYNISNDLIHNHTLHSHMYRWISVLCLLTIKIVFVYCT